MSQETLREIVAEMRESDRTRGPCYAKDWADRIERASAQGGEDAARLDWAVKNARWIRHEHEAYVAIPVALDADLSCFATRMAAIDAARATETPR